MGSMSGIFDVGGLVGAAVNASTIVDSCATGSDSDSASVEGLVGYNNYSTVSNYYWDIGTPG